MTKKVKSRLDSSPLLSIIRDIWPAAAAITALWILFGLFFFIT